MSDDLISRQAAIDALEREKSLVERPITETRWFDFGLRKAQDVLSGLPSAQERKKGKWIDKEGMYICSECGRPTEDRHDVPCEFDGHKGLALVLPFYCGFCGAEMEGEEDEREKVHRVLA